MSWNSNLNISFELKSADKMKEVADNTSSEYQEFEWFLQYVREFEWPGTRMMFCFAKQFNHLAYDCFMGELQRFAAALYKAGAIASYCNILVMYEVEQAENLSISQIKPNGGIRTVSEIDQSWGVW